MVLSLIIVPPTMLMLLSLPPLKPVFVDRYIVYSAALIWTLSGIIIALSFQPKAKEKFCHLFLPALLTTLLIITSVIGINLVSRGETEDYHYLKNFLTEIQTLSQPDEPILAKDAWIYYDGSFYSTDENPVYGVDSWLDLEEYGSLKPIQNYRINLIDDLDDFSKQNDRLWYITYQSDLADFESPIEGFHATFFLDDGHFAAVELERDA